MTHDEQVLELQHEMGNGLLVLEHLHRQVLELARMYRMGTDSGSYERDLVRDMHRRARRIERALAKFYRRKFAKRG